MAAPKKASLAAARAAVAALRPLPKNYGMWVSHHFPEVDLQRLYRLVAGRKEYDEGLNALRTVCALYGPKKNQQLVSTPNFLTHEAA